MSMIVLPTRFGPRFGGQRRCVEGGGLIGGAKLEMDSGNSSFDQALVQERQREKHRSTVGASASLWRMIPIVFE